MKYLHKRIQTIAQKYIPAKKLTNTAQQERDHKVNIHTIIRWATHSKATHQLFNTHRYSPRLIQSPRHTSKRIIQTKAHHKYRTIRCTKKTYKQVYTHAHIYILTHIQTHAENLTNTHSYLPQGITT